MQLLHFTHTHTNTQFMLEYTLPIRPIKVTLTHLLWHLFHKHLQCHKIYSILVLLVFKNQDLVVMMGELDRCAKILSRVQVWSLW